MSSEANVADGSHKARPVIPKAKLAVEALQHVQVKAPPQPAKSQHPLPLSGHRSSLYDSCPPEKRQRLESPPDPRLPMGITPPVMFPPPPPMPPMGVVPPAMSPPLHPAPPQEAPPQEASVAPWRLPTATARKASYKITHIASPPKSTTQRKESHNKAYEQLREKRAANYSSCSKTASICVDAAPKAHSRGFDWLEQAAKGKEICKAEAVEAPGDDENLVEQSDEFVDDATKAEVEPTLDEDEDDLQVLSVNIAKQKPGKKTKAEPPSPSQDVSLWEEAAQAEQVKEEGAKEEEAEEEEAKEEETTEQEGKSEHQQEKGERQGTHRCHKM